MPFKSNTISHPSSSDFEEQQLNDRARIFEDFLTLDFDAPNGNHKYRQEIVRLLRADETRLIVNIDDLRDYNRDFANGLLKQPVDYLPAFEKALYLVIQRMPEAEKYDIDSKNYRIGLSGSFGDHHVIPRTLHAAQLGKMVSV